jgi:large subunit ribosomal protein L21
MQAKTVRFSILLRMGLPKPGATLPRRHAPAAPAVAFDPAGRSMYNRLFSRFNLRPAQIAPEDSFKQLMRFQIMYAVIKTGGKQYKVVAGEKLKIEQIPADIGSEITIDQVLAVGEGESIKFGAPLVEGASVRVTVVSQGRHDKVRIFKMRRRKHYQKRQGHRQNYTEIQVVAING